MIIEPAASETTEARAPERSVLEIPPDPASIRTARLFAAAVARHFACAEGEVEDVRLAVSEAVTSAVRAQSDLRDPTPIRVAAERADSRLLFEITSTGPPPVAPEAGQTPPGGLYEGSLGVALVDSLFDDSAIARTSDGGTLVAFSLAIIPELMNEND
ncbi:MAG: ATP-binding protein [Actinobacteria bacterium]|nr:ATP-binding protein [Actinomycetota bacterium]